MIEFVHSPLLWGLAIVAIPVAIHLINLLRHRKVRWAAMEFLLQSQRKNSTWIRLKELLLLLLRMAAVAALVMIVAQPELRNRVGRLLGSGETHHIVLLDDSYSMSDRTSGGSAFNRAVQAVQRIGEHAARQSTPQRFTLLRFSEAHSAAGETHPDLLEEKVDSRFVANLRASLGKLSPSQLASGPGPAVRAIEQLLGKSSDGNRVVYIVSDFRTREWNEPSELTKNLAKFNDTAARLLLVRCVDAPHANLGITALAPQPGTRAAGVPLGMRVTVHNYGSEPAKNVSVALEEDGNGRPALTIDQVPPGQSETRPFPVFFAQAGPHVITARLESDAVAADNVRYSLVDLPASAAALIVDGSPEATDAFYLGIALAPGGNAPTGIRVQSERPSYLNTHPIDNFAALYLCNVERLDPPALEAVRKYVRGGGGLAIFLGPSVDKKFYNEQLYEAGKGLLPMPLLAHTQLLVDRLDKAPDLEVTNTPLFRVFAGERNSYLADVAIDRYFAAPRDWKPDPQSTVRVLAKLRNGAPLAIERQYGQGRVLTFTTTAAPVWNNWARSNPSFVVFALELESFLAAASQRDESRVVGTPLELALDPVRYQPRVRMIPPGTRDLAATAISADATTTPQGLQAKFTQTLRSGVYEVQLTTTDQQLESRFNAVNVDPSEGDLATIGRPELAERLKGVRFELHEADEPDLAPTNLAQSNLSQWILFGLVALLLGEQALAYSASYHPGRQEVRV